MLLFEDIKSLDENFTTVEVVNHFLKESFVDRGVAFKIKCPFHNERTASMLVYPESRGTYCFGCGISGNLYSWTKNFLDIWGEANSHENVMNYIKEHFNAGVEYSSYTSFNSKKEFEGGLKVLNDKIALIPCDKRHLCYEGIREGVFLALVKRDYNILKRFLKVKL